MNMIQLKTFCVVARTLSFTAASEELMLSQPAVSRQIAGLEEEIDAKLFTRGHNTLALTPAGAQLYEDLPEKLADLENLFFKVHLMDIGKIRRLKLGVLRDQQMDPLVLSVIRQMRSENYYVTLQQYDFQNLEKAVLKHEIDVAIALRWTSNAFEGCESMILREEPLCLAVNQDFAPEIPEELNREHLTEFSRKRPTMIPETASFSRSQYGTVAAKMTQFWNGVVEEATDVVVPMVQTGIGTALVNQSHVLGKEPSVALYPLDFLEPVEIAAFWSESKQNNVKEDFLDRLSGVTD